MVYKPGNLRLIGNPNGASPLEISLERIQLLGTIMARWATLEYALLFLLVDIVGDYNVAEAVLYTRNQWSQRSELIKGLVHAATWNEAKKQAAIAVLEKVDAHWQERSDLVHSRVHASAAFPDADFGADVIKQTPKSSQDGLVDLEDFRREKPHFAAVLPKRLATYRKPGLALTVEFLQAHADKVADLNMSLTRLIALSPD